MNDVSAALSAPPASQSNLLWWGLRIERDVEFGAYAVVAIDLSASPAFAAARAALPMVDEQRLFCSAASTPALQDVLSQKMGARLAEMAWPDVAAAAQGPAQAPGHQAASASHAANVKMLSFRLRTAFAEHWVSSEWVQADDDDGAMAFFDVLARPDKIHRVLPAAFGKILPDFMSEAAALLREAAELIAGPQAIIASQAVGRESLQDFLSLCAAGIARNEMLRELGPSAAKPAVRAPRSL